MKIITLEDLQHFYQHTKVVDWAENTEYKKGRFLLYNDTLYMCKTTFTTGIEFSEENLLRVRGIDRKTIVFAGTQYEIPAIYDGIITKLIITIPIKITEDTNIIIQRMTKDDYKNDSKNWTTIGEGKFAITKNDKYLEYSINSNNKVTSSDMLRISTESTGLENSVFSLVEES